MRFPFFKNKIVEVNIDVSNGPKKTEYGLKEGENISLNSFKTIEENHKDFYKKRVANNTEVLENKRKAAKVWMEYAIELIKDIPKNYISAVYIQEDPRNDLESLTHPIIFLKFTVDYGESKQENEYSVYAKEHTDSERCIMRLLEDIRQIKKKIASLNKDKTNETL